MSDLKRQLIKLGSTYPELRPHIREVLSYTDGRGVISSDQDGQSTLLNLKGLIKHTGLRKYGGLILKEAENLIGRKGNAEIPVKVPEGFESLFSSIYIYMQVNDTHISMDWKYRHPSGGGNGLFLGMAATDGWRSSSGDVGGKVWGF